MIRKSAVLAYPDETGEPAARLIIERDAIASGTAPDYARTAAWLMCNPSRANAEIDDPTLGRVMGHSFRYRCARQLAGNVWPLRTPYPADLWPRLAAGEYHAEMRAANLDALAAIGAQADLLVVAFGAAPGRSHYADVCEALLAFTTAAQGPLYCLGTTDDGWPLHPLARGKLAVRKDTPLVEWDLPAA